MKVARYAAVLLLLVLAFGIGCQRGDDGAKAGAGTAVEPVTIQYWARAFDEVQDAWREKWLEAFHAAQDEIIVELTLVSPGGWDEKMTGAQAVGETPDIVHYAYNQVLPAATNQELLPLDDYISADVLDDVYDNVRAMVTMDGKMYAFPELVEPSTVLYYNKEMFSAAGLDPEKPPETWDDLITYAKALTTDDHYGLIIPFNAVELGWSLWGQRYGHVGHRLISEDWSKSLADDAAYQEFAEFWASLYAEEVVPRQALAAYVDIAPFANEQAAMSFCGSWAAGTIKRDFPDLVDKVGVTNAPTQDGDYRKATASLGGWTLGIDGMSDNPQAAGDFIAWTLGGNPQIMVEFFTGLGFSKYTARESVDLALLSDPEASSDPWMAVIAERIVPYAVAETAYPFGINIAFGNAVERMILQDMDADESFGIAHKEIQDIIENEGISGKNPAN